MRRLISSILAILVLVLSCFPCNDVNAMPSNYKATRTIIKSASSNDDSGSHATDVCSPFCTCSCCAGFTIPAFEAIALKPTPPFIKRVFASYLPEAINEIALPIWQPPQSV